MFAPERFVETHHRPSASCGKLPQRAVLHDGNASVVRHIEERELDEIARMQIVAIQRICEDHFKEGVVRDDTGARRAVLLKVL